MTAAYLHLMGNKLLISFEFNKYLNKELNKIPGTRWNKTFSRWEAPLNTYPRLLSVLDDVKISNAVMNKLKEEADLKLQVENLRKKNYHELTDYAPKIPLMSHQKKAFELHRMLPGSGNFSEMGSGKCLKPDSLVNVDGNLIEIKKLWEQYASKDRIITSEGVWASTTKNIHVLSMNGKKFSKRKVSKLFRQQIKETLRKITLDDGSIVTTTKAHKFYSSLFWTNKLSVGDRVCVPKILPHEFGSFDLEMAELFGWMVGEGSERSGSKNAHRFTQKNPIEMAAFKNVLQKVTRRYGIDLNIRDVKRKDKVPVIEFCNKNFVNLCVEKGYKWGRHSRDKAIPDGIMGANKLVVAAFLRSFFDGEAHVNVNRNQVEISSASQFLMKQLNVLLRRFGVWLRVTKKRKCATNGTRIYRNYWDGRFGGPSLRTFKEKIGFSVDYKIGALDKICEIKPNSNVEGVPAYKILREIIDKTGLPIRHITDSYTIYLKGTQEPSRETLQVFINNIDKIIDGTKYIELSNLPSPQIHQFIIQTYARCGSYKNVANVLNSYGMTTKRGYEWHGPTVKKIVTKGEDFPYKDVYDSLDIEWLKEKRNQLQQLIDQEVHYATIKSIEEIDYEGWVYDLEVDPDHNYVAENILCHNTGSAICSIHWHLEMGNIDKALVVCPKSVLRGWEEQIEMFSDLSYVSITGLKKEERLRKLALDRNIYLINYEYTWRITDLLLERGFNLVVADEAHRIKNPQSKQSKAVYRLADAAEYRIALTGTPVLNSSLDAFGVMRFIDSTVFGESYYSFRSRFFKNVGPDNSPIQIYVPRRGADKEISDKLYTRALRFLKDECMDLPVATHLPARVVYLSRDQDKAYRNLQEQLCAQITENKSIKINHVLALMLKLNQITSGWVKDSETGEIIHFKSNPKLEELKAVVEEAGDQPIILWAYYKADMKLLCDYYGRCQKCKAPINNIPEDKCPGCGNPIKYRCSEVQGSTKYRNAEIAKFRLTTKERAELRTKFTEEGLTPAEIRNELGDLLPDGSEPPQTNIIICQCVAASEGLNLQRATLAVFYSRNWSLKDWTQALARNHRKGQTKKVTYINLVAKMENGDDTIDQRIVNALTKKEDLSKRVNKDDIKLLVGNFKKKDREAFKDLTVEEPIEEIESPDDNDTEEIDPEQKSLF